jgi:ABC-type transport system involved in cytochrome c biogenesis ATPase subunit
MDEYGSFKWALSSASEWREKFELLYEEHEETLQELASVKENLSQLSDALDKANLELEEDIFEDFDLVQ